MALPAHQQGSYRSAFGVTPSDVTPIAGEAVDALYIGGTAGSANDITVVAITESGDVVVFPYQKSGSILPVRIRQVAATGTTVGAQLLGLRR